MALPTTYSTGTASVTAGDVTVTGQGTTWLTSGIQAGDLFWAAGADCRIASVNSNTSLTLAYAWPGATRAAAAYEIRFTPDATRVLASARQLLDQLTNGNLASISGLASAADKLAYFTGVGVAGLTDFKAKGRDIAAADTLTTLLGKLGPVFGGTAPAPSGAGLGLADGDFNTIIVPGLYTIAGAWANGPSGAAASGYTGLLEVYARVFANGYYQILRIGTQTWRRYTSVVNAASWANPWALIEQPTVGTASQSGGVPTGAIIERGTNANGDYVRFADGTQMCWTKTPLTMSVATTLAGGWVYPVTFLSTSVPAVSCVANWSETTGTLTSAGYQTYGSVSALGILNNSCSLRLGKLSGVNFVTGDGVTAYCVAIGRWF